MRTEDEYHVKTWINPEGSPFQIPMMITFVSVSIVVSLPETIDLLNGRVLGVDLWFDFSIAFLVASLLSFLIWKTVKLNFRIEEDESDRELLLMSVSHDVRKSLNGIRGATHAIKEKSLETQGSGISSLEAHTKSLGELLDNLMTTREAAKEVDKSHREDCDFQLLLRDLVAQENSRIADGLIHLSLKIDEAVPQFLRLNSIGLRLAMTHLIRNCVSITKEGVVKIICAMDEEDDRVKVKFMVQDSKRKVELDNLDPIFEETQPHNLKSLIASFGLGLYVVRDKLGGIGGTIDLDNEPGKGLLFYLDFPYFQLKQLSNSGSYAMQQPNESFFNGSGQEVLVVDDNNIDLLIAERALRRMGVSVEKAYSGQEAVSKCEKKTYSLILMDLVMPGMDGLEASRILTHYFVNHPDREAPIVAMTGNVSNLDRLRSEDSGMVDYCAKPLMKAELHRILSRFL